MNEKHNCPSCGWRKKFEDHPQSFLGRLWKWHTKFCPGWKSYLASLTDEERKRIEEKLNK